MCGRDSTVTLGAGRKGRSSSRALNAELRRTMAHVIGGDLYTADFFVDTRRNPADHPTRAKNSLFPPRRCGPPREWVARALAGEVDPFWARAGMHGPSAGGPAHAPRGQ